MKAQMYNPKRKCSVHSNFDFRVNLRSTHRYFWYDAGGYDVMWCLRKLCLGSTQDWMISKTHRGNFAIALNLMDTNFIQIEATVHELLNIASPTEWSTNYLQTVEMKRILHCGPSKIATHNYKMLIMYYLSQNVFDDVTIIPIYGGAFLQKRLRKSCPAEATGHTSSCPAQWICDVFNVFNI